MRTTISLGSLLLSVLAATGAQAQGVTVQDLRGQTLTFERPPQRIVTIPIPAASMLMGLDGSARRVVGMNPTAMTAIKGEWLASVFPESLGINVDVVRGGQFVPNIETLLALKPDVVFQWADQGDHLTAPIERAGLRLFGQKYGTQAYLEQTITAMGRMLGRDEKARALIARHKAVRAEVEKALAGLKADEKPRAIYLGRTKQSLLPHGMGSYQVESFELAGARNAAEGIRGTSTNVTFEQFLAWAPDVIFVGAFDDAVPADLYNDPKWASVPAVRDRRVYKLPTGGYRWDPPNLESPLTWMWMATLLHPTRVSFDIRREMDDLIAFIYGRSPTEDEAARILRIADNALSRGYDRISRR